MKHLYIRDGRAPIPLRESTSKVMSANRAKDTQPELSLRRSLWKEGIKGYRLNWKKAPGRPDIAFPARKIAIFLNGCFWHRCPHCRPNLPKTHKGFWELKFKKNEQRDKDKISHLKQDGWEVLTIWECQLKKNPQEFVILVKELLSINKMRSK